MTLAFTLLGCTLFVTIAMSHRRMARAISATAPAPRRRATYPPITVIRPIRDLDPGCRDNTRALLFQNYPGPQQTLFVFDSAHDAAVPVVARTIRESGVNAEILIAGPPPRHRTGKLNAMIVGLKHATGELVAFSDSDTRPGPGLLRTLVEELLARPDAVFERELFWRMKHRDQRAMRAGPWKYLHLDGHEFLFDVTADGRERANLARRHPERLSAMRARFEAWNAAMPKVPSDAAVHVVYGEADIPRPTA